MTQPTEELSENRQGDKKEKSRKKKQKEKRKEKQQASEKNGTYGLTKAEDKEPHRSAAQPQEPLEPSSKPHALQVDSSQQRSTTMFGTVNSPATNEAHPATRSSTSLLGDSHIAVPPNATWEEVRQFALNSSILSGMFEDVRILACSRRSQALARAGSVRALHANSALVRKALTSSHLLLDTDVLPDVLEDADIRDIDASFQAGHHDYLEDSDLEDGDISIELEPEPKLEEHSDGENDDDEESASESAEAPPDADGTTNPAITSASNQLQSTEDGSKDVDEAAEAGTQEDRAATSKNPGAAASAQDGLGQGGEEDVGSPTKDASNSKATGPGVQVDGPEGPVKQPSDVLANQSKAESHDVGLGPGTRTVLVTDTAFQTLRTFIFFAYTGRVAFAPLRSQGMIYRDSGRDASQLPVCSPKSMYRLAVKYGSETLRIQAGSDILSKLSTHNILDELFSRFTCRYPQIQDMELNFLLAHIKHPDVTTRLPWWINRFALGELATCADTFGMLIHKLACIAPPDQFGGLKPPSFCPRGCPMPTIRAQFRCNTCGYVMT
ncbi:hypothetical protein GSI_03881 [Ganoderma sinense ZZ0214-1]|uniref:BTB domain-containing protein n=1 Tax=Ganoderma sinense ZZ0214-1 TaxID=1077348 RepID=A0A2G8SK90_9APHY|nr:hypothetical protein GSI_03881 [Ganoderma sinense ZZ0214-1]